MTKTNIYHIETEVKRVRPDWVTNSAEQDEPEMPVLSIYPVKKDEQWVSAYDLYIKDSVIHVNLEGYPWKKFRGVSNIPEITSRLMTAILTHEAAVADEN